MGKQPTKKKVTYLKKEVTTPEHNRSGNRYIISYDRKSSLKSSEKIREEIKTFLSEEGCEDIESYTDTCILFTSDISFTSWVNKINDTLSPNIWCVVAKIEKVLNGMDDENYIVNDFRVAYDPKEKLEDNFENI